jgi:NAD(P)-dependent dehydrogenase (short-subunit alcohol dehydrogenase family)
MQSTRVALVTGANKGIGKEIVRKLAKSGYTVLLGARDRARGDAAAAELRGEGDIRPIEIDVSDAASITATAARIRSELGRLDVLVNNAGIARSATAARGPTATPASAASLAEVREVFETNVFGVIAVTQAMLPLLREAPAGRIVNVSSGLGSLAAVTNPQNAYRKVGGVSYGPSKTALNAVTIAFAADLEGTRIKVNAACPGYTATDLNGHSGPRSAEEGAREPFRLATLADDGPTGTFSNDAGSIAW